MSSHTAFVLASYLSAAIALTGLIAWIFIDQRSQRNALRELEARGVRRRSGTDSAS
ncbi:heme exporter protein CcmD [Phyllobacterium sp. YR531]|uniref:heme exporter protein CcmD n=1 Tax=Phyllobacterium sp. YR531 TaxID=1144343 RepID=UPI00026FBB6E|nr:heme exporter protein CcmD [Phyllobacterium sp. YR531]EJM99846.1 heme exporter protein CcmD [Phyllobacterium sp. YR531]